MAQVDWESFLDKLAAWMAAGTSPALVYSSVPRALWIGSALEADAADPYSVLRIYGGAVPYPGPAKCSIQCRTVGTSVAAAMQQAVKLFNTLINADQTPKRMTTIAASPNGFRANAIDPLQPPSFLSRDDRGRAEVIFNFDASVVGLP